MSEVRPGDPSPADLLAPRDVPQGLDVERVTAWLDDNVAGATGPYDFEVIAGGHSNLTYRVSGGSDRPLVLRRPPLGHVLASAHDMSREHRVIAGLQDSAVPVPRARAFCADPSVTGAPFYVMDFVDGHVIRDRVQAEAALTIAARAAASRSVVDTLARIHAVDLDATGLADLGRHEGYVARQLARWYRQWNAGSSRELPAIDRVHARLSERIPEQGPATLVHGDYRLDNCIVDDDGTVVAVLDWEICTLGDPLADLGLLQVYWTGPDDGASAWAGTATAADGFWNRADLVTRYAAVSGRDVDQLDFYVAFSYWKLACILEGVYVRYRGGALGEQDPDTLHAFRQQVDDAAAAAERTAEELR